jgi:cell division protein FtsL
MSTPAIATRPSVAPVRRQPARRPLRAVPASDARKARPKLAYALWTVGGVAAIFIAQLLLSVALSHGAYEISGLRSQITELGYQKESLGEELETLSSPQYVATAAQELGMVVNSTPAYLRLSDGAVLGQPGEAGGASSIPLGPTEYVGNAAVDALPGATTGTEEEGAPAEDAESTPVTFEDGLPSPQTH